MCSYFRKSSQYICFFFSIVKGFRSKMELEDRNWRISQMVPPKNRTTTGLQKAKIYLLTNERPPRTLLHLQANELTAWTLGGLPPPWTPGPQMQPAPNFQRTCLQLAFPEFQFLWLFRNKLNVFSFERASCYLLI